MQENLSCAIHERVDQNNKRDVIPYQLAREGTFKYSPKAMWAVQRTSMQNFEFYKVSKYAHFLFFYRV